MDRFLTVDVYATEVGDQVVLLDAAGDRYFCVPDGSALTLDRDRAAIRFADQALCRQMTAAGLVAPGAPGAARTPSRPWPRPTRDLPQGLGGRLTPRDWTQAAIATADVLANYSGRSFGGLLAAARAARDPGVNRSPPDGVIRAAAGFRRWAPFTPLPAKCLLRSFMLLRHLRRAGQDAAWVFGVATFPFTAHCWIQAGDMVLDDHWERLAAYEPVLVI